MNKKYEFKHLPNGQIVAFPKAKETKNKENTQGFGNRRSTEVLVLSDKFLYRRDFSTLQLIKNINKEDFKDGNSIHIITGGNVDQLSYLELILLQQKVEYCLISTWVMAEEDIKQIEEWIDEGKLKKVDFYLGEIFPTQYVIAYKMLKDLVEKTACGRIAVFRNHSKIIAGWGGFPFVVETSANVNTNPRTEQGVITVNRELVDFYKKYFDGIKGFNEAASNNTNKNEQNERRKDKS